MSKLMERLGINELSIHERILLMRELYESIAKEESVWELTDEQSREIDRRIALYRANPDDVVMWEEVKARLQAER